MAESEISVNHNYDSVCQKLIEIITVKAKIISLESFNPSVTRCPNTNSVPAREDWRKMVIFSPKQTKMDCPTCVLRTKLAKANCSRRPQSTWPHWMWERCEEKIQAKPRKARIPKPETKLVDFCAFITQKVQTIINAINETIIFVLFNQMRIFEVFLDNLNSILLW